MPTRRLNNGDLVETRLVHHRDGKKSIKRKVVAKGVRQAPSLAPVSILKREPAPIEAKTKSAKRNAKKIAKADSGPKLATPETIKERTHHEDARSLDKSAYVTTTNQVPKTLRRIKARTGSHIEQFMRDYELAGSDLRSANLDSGSGGGSAGVPFPLAKVQAIDRLKGFQEKNYVAFTMCEAVLIHNATPASIHAKGGPQHVVVSHMIRESVEALASYYTPNKKRPDKMLAVLTKIIESARREADSRA